MKLIDLLNKIANGEIEEDVMFEYSHGNGYKEFCTTRQFFNRYIVDKENLNLEICEDKPFNKRVEEIYNRHIDYIYGKEYKKIEKIPKKDKNGYIYLYSNEELEIIDKLNEIIDKINEENK